MLEETKPKDPAPKDSAQDKSKAPYKWKETEFKKYSQSKHSQGYIDEYYDDQQCDSWLLIPGVRLMDQRFMAVIYFLTLLYLFLGISIIADIFMEAIEVICSKTTIVEVRDNNRNVYFLEVPVWNATIANLTLMALGSSAPEILLSVIETLTTLGEVPGELGVFSIVGSAAFNLLFISAVCIASAGDETKKIYDLGVFFTTSIFSIWAYVWMYIVLSGEGEQNGVIEVWEAWLTVSFFIILCILAYGADRYKASQDKKVKDRVAIEEQNKQDAIKVKRSQLREFARRYGDSRMLQVGQGQSPLADEWDAESKILTESEEKTIRTLFTDLLGEDSKSADASKLLELLQPETLLERFAAKKKVSNVHPKDFLHLQADLKGQLEHKDAKIHSNLNDVGFKCLHYSVTESTGRVTITIVKKPGAGEAYFGVRTVQGTAKTETDFEAYDEMFTMAKKDDKQTFDIVIKDDQHWEPEKDFYIEIYDLESTKRLPGDNTKATVTILDEDFPGYIQFIATEIKTFNDEQNVTINILRTKGCDGSISCVIKTQDFMKGNEGHCAIEHEHYLPIHEKITFDHGESEKQITIQLVPPSKHDKILNTDT